MMITLETRSWPKFTLGILKAGSFKCCTLELPDKNNSPDISCIPAGTYRWVEHMSPNNGKCLLIKDVPGRTHIQIHYGNYTRDIRGCILPGDSIKFLDKDDILDVANSRATLSKLMAAVPSEGTIVITRG